MTYEELFEDQIFDDHTLNIFGNFQYSTKTNEFSYESVNVLTLCTKNNTGSPFNDFGFEFPVLSFNISHIVDSIVLERPDGHLTFCDLRFTYKFIQGRLSQIISY